MAAPPRPGSPGLPRKEKERDWSALPEGPLETIGTKLPSRRDAVKFRTVCPAWRAALPYAMYLAPLLMLPSDPESPDDAVTFYTVADGGGSTFTRNLPSLRGKRLCGSSRGWLALVDQGQDASVTLLNPLTGAIVELPPADEHVVGASFRLLLEPNGIPSARLLLEDGQYTNVRLDEMNKRAFRQIVLSSSSPGSGDCVAMASLADSGTVAFCRVGVDGAWTLLDTNLPVGPVTSVLHFRGTTFLAINDGRSGDGGIAICDVAAGAAPTATRVQYLRAGAAPKPTTWARSYLQVNGMLYVVATVSQGSTLLYKCNILGVDPRWTRVKNTHGLTFFISSNFTAGYGGAATVAGFRRNTIYAARPDPDRNQLELEVIDIANGTSEFQPYHNNIPGSGPLCWIQPHHWA